MGALIRRLFGDQMNKQNDNDTAPERRPAEPGDTEITLGGTSQVMRAKNKGMVRAKRRVPDAVRDRDLGAFRRHPPSDWQRVLRIMAKQWRWSVLFTVTIVALATVATLAMNPVYESEGRLQIDPPGSEVFSLDAAGAGLIDSEYITTEALKIQTDDLALATIRALHLDANPEITGKVPKRAAIGEGPNDLTPEENAAIRGFKSRLSIRRDPSSRLVAVTFASHEPRLSADVVNSLMKLLVEQNFEVRNKAIAESTKWLSRQLDDIREKMEKTTQALADFATKTGIVDMDPNSNTYGEKMGDLSKQLVQAQSDRIQFEAFLKPVLSDPDSLPQIRNNLLIQALTQKLAEAEAQLAQSSVIYGPNHAEVRKLQNQVNQLRGNLKGQREAIVSELWTSYRAARARERLLREEVKGATTELATLAQYNVLKKEAQVHRDLYDALYTKIKEAGITAASKSSNIHIVSQARVLDDPTRPHLGVNVMAGVLIGLIGGVVLAFVKDRIEDRIHTADDVRDWRGLPSIAAVPAIQTSHNGVAVEGPNRPGLLLPRSTGNGCDVPECFLLRRPNAPESEAVRALAAMLLLSLPGHEPKVILVTSPLPAEGKTTLADNLAVALTKHGRTCLLDADLRRPAVRASFRLAPQVGLKHYLQGSATLEEITSISTAIRGLAIIPSTMPSEDAIQLLTEEPFKALITQLREHFSFVVIDTPPIMPYADGLALSTLVDGVVLVGRAGQTPRGAITRSMEMLEAVNSAPILAVVLNGASKRYDYGGYN